MPLCLDETLNLPWYVMKFDTTVNELLQIIPLYDQTYFWDISLYTFNTEQLSSVFTSECNILRWNPQEDCFPEFQSSSFSGTTTIRRTRKSISCHFPRKSTCLCSRSTPDENVWFTIHHYLVVDLALPLFLFHIHCRRVSLRWFHLFVDWGDDTPPDVNIASRWFVLSFYVIVKETRFHTKRDPWGLALMVLLSTMMLLLRHAGIGRWTLAFDPMLDWCWCMGCGNSWCWGS